MAKDPATLWYWNDWFSGTTLMSRFLKGCYIDLLHAQFNNGRLSLEEIKTCLGSDFGQAWPTLQKKFTKDDSGLFFNERLEHEKLKRSAYSESRKKNRSKKTYVDTYKKHMSPHMENENENRNELKGKGGLGEKEITDQEVLNTIEFCSITLSRKYDPAKITELWKAFCILHESHINKKERLKHFRNWIKTQPYGNQKDKPGTSAARMEALKNWGKIS